jgi:hypothetical protein
MSRGKLFATAGAVAALAAGLAAPASQACRGGSSHDHHSYGGDWGYSHGNSHGSHHSHPCDHNGGDGSSGGGGPLPT